MMGRRGGRLVLGLVLVLLVTTMVACGDDENEQESSGQEARQSTQEVEQLLSFPESLAYGGLLPARELGYFEDEGLEVESEASDGAGFVTQQVVAGNVDFGWATADSIIAAASKFPDVRAVSCVHLRNIFRITVPEESDVQSVEDLSGKTLGFTEKGGGEEPLVDTALRDAGIIDDVTKQPIGGAGPQSRRAIDDGAVDAYASSYQDIATLSAQGGELRDITPEKFSRVPGGCLMVMAPTLEDPEKREVIAKIARAWTKGAVFAIENPEAALELACPRVPEECKNRELASAIWGAAVSLLEPVDETVSVGGVDKEGFEVAAKSLLDAGTIEKAVDVDMLVDSEEVRTLIDEIQDFDAEAVKQAARDAEAGS